MAIPKLFGDTKKVVDEILNDYAGMILCVRMKVLSIPIAILIFVIFSQAQTVTDADRRAFDDLRSIFIDVDGDGKLDEIKPRTYQTYEKRPGRKLLNKHISNWITFDISTTKGLKIRSFFTYKYGTDEQGGSYWVYALIAAGDLNKDGKADLIFYSGDDTSDESIKLINRQTRFSVLSRRVCKLSDERCVN